MKKNRPPNPGKIHYPRRRSRRTLTVRVTNSVAAVLIGLIGLVLSLGLTAWGVYLIYRIAVTVHAWPFG